MASPVRLIPLGGLGEVGMNCMLLEEEGRIVLIDCGVLFDGRGLGVDVIHADWEYLESRRESIEALVLTHGHEDHLGAVSYFLREFGDIPIYGPPYALALVKERLPQHVWHHGARFDFRVLERGVRLPIGPFAIEPWQVTHSMPECMGLFITTAQGMIVHSGDFKIDEAPPDGDRFDSGRLAEVAADGVRMLLSDSTNALANGRASRELDVSAHLLTLAQKTEGRLIVGLFASNVHRLAALIDIARQCGRRVVGLGRAIHTHLAIATELGIMRDASDVLVPREKAKEIPRERMMGLATGTQGEPRAALLRLANGSHPDLELAAGDQVILSSRVIPGNERGILDMVEVFERRGISVLQRSVDPKIHASGHGHRDELRSMIEQVEPRSFLPVHGTFVHLRSHAGIARELGVPNVLTALNGDVIELSDTGERVAEHVWSGRIHVDQGGERVDGRVLGERRAIAEAGVLFVSITVDETGRALSSPVLRGSGVFHPEDDTELVRQCERAAEREVKDLSPGHRLTIENDKIEEALRRAIRRVCQKELGKKPYVMAVVHRVAAERN